MVAAVKAAPVSTASSHSACATARRLRHKAAACHRLSLAGVQDYRAVGKVAGRFYDDMGRATALLTRIQAVKAPRRPPQRAATPGTQSCKMHWDATASKYSAVLFCASRLVVLQVVRPS